MTWVSLFIPRGILSASSSPAAALSTVHMPPRRRSSFRDGAASPGGELEENLQRGSGARVPCHPPLRPPRASTSFPAPAASPTPSEKPGVGRGAERQAAGGCFLGGRALGKEASWRNRRGSCHRGPDLVLQEECKELIVSLPRSDFSRAPPRRVERALRWSLTVSGQRREERGRLPWPWVWSKPVLQRKFWLWAPQALEILLPKIHPGLYTLQRA